MLQCSKIFGMLILDNHPHADPRLEDLYDLLESIKAIDLLPWKPSPDGRIQLRDGSRVLRVKSMEPPTQLELRHQLYLTVKDCHRILLLTNATAHKNLL